MNREGSSETSVPIRLAA